MESTFVSLQYATPSLHDILTRCIGWRKQHQISYLKTLMKTGSEIVGATLVLKMWMNDLKQLTKRHKYW